MKKLLHMLLFISLALPLHAMQPQDNNNSFVQQQQIDEAKRFVKDNALKFLVLLSPFVLIAFIAYNLGKHERRIQELETKNFLDQLKSTDSQNYIRTLIQSTTTKQNDTNKRSSDSIGDTNGQPASTQVTSNANQVPAQTQPATAPVVTQNAGDPAKPAIQS